MFSSSLNNNATLWGVMPDYNARIAITSGYVAPTVGWVAIGVNGAGVVVNINGESLTGTLFTSYDRGGGGIFPVNKGDEVTFTNAQPAYAYFYPCKGAI